MKIRLLSIFLFLNISFGMAQNDKGLSKKLVSEYRTAYIAKTNGTYTISLTEKVSSFYISAIPEDTVNIRINGYSASWNAHLAKSDKLTSRLYFKKEFKDTTIQLNLNMNNSIQMLLVPALKEKIKAIPTQLKKEENCSKPEMILGNEWRQGLNPPKTGRTPTVVQHLIVHHSAGSNTATSWTETVRNIYIYHTESNGWDDIGYNFLIAPNGIIYEGRDPQEVDEIDNIQGAHFCSKNSGTMGICMIGTYSTASPPDTMLISLRKLLSWKAHKDGLYPKGSSIHPKNGSEYLPTIAGHRDGCATACPGDFLYTILPNIIDSVEQDYIDCGNLVSTHDHEANNRNMIYPNPFNQELRLDQIQEFSEIKVYNQWGMQIHQSLNKSRIQTNEWPAGFYTLHVMDSNGQLTYFKVLRSY